MTELRHAYRANRHEFTENQAVKRLNDKLQQSHSFEGKAISLNLRESGIDEWKGDMTISLDGIPLENSGFGTQNMFKSEIFLLQNSDVDILIIEEPENNLSYANMSILISKLSESTGKQLFVSTHSSFVANKLGLQYLHLVANESTVSFKMLSKDTYDYFLKLPGYNTLRILLANHVILVEQFGAVIKSMKADYQEMYSSIKDKPLLMTTHGLSDEVQYVKKYVTSQLTGYQSDIAQISMAIQKSKYDGTDHAYEKCVLRLEKTPENDD